MVTEILVVVTEISSLVTGIDKAFLNEMASLSQYSSQSGIILVL